MGVDRSPLYLAAIASAAVPGLDPVTVEALPSLPEDRFDVAFVRDTEHRRWVVRAPRSEAAGAAMDASTALLGLLARRVSLPSRPRRASSRSREAVARPSTPISRATRSTSASSPEGPGLAADLGRVLAGIHNLDPALVDEAGLPTYTADDYRVRHLSDLDRAAATGRVPTALLARWERALEDVSLWRFAATPVHGNVTGDQVLVVFDGDDAGSGRVRGLVGWEFAKVADPADDFAALVDQADPEVVDRVLEAYAHARVERPDPNLLVRARLAAELGLLAELMDAVARKDEAAIEGYSSRLRRLDEQVHSLEESTNDYQRLSLTPASQRQRVVAPPAELEDDNSDGDEDLTPLSPSTADLPDEAEQPTEQDEDEHGAGQPDDQEPVASDEQTHLGSDDQERVGSADEHEHLESDDEEQVASDHERPIGADDTGSSPSGEDAVEVEAKDDDETGDEPRKPVSRADTVEIRLPGSP